jgi:hypothetical protein
MLWKEEHPRLRLIVISSNSNKTAMMRVPQNQRLDKRGIEFEGQELVKPAELEK